VSVLNRKQPVTTATKLRGHAAHAASAVAGGAIATKALPLAQQAAQQAVPMARTAGSSVKQGSDNAVAWATPYVDAARSWAAPQIEQSAHTISETLAPMISSALINAAHKIDTPPKQKKGHGKLTAAAMLTALAGIATVIAMRLRQHPDSFAAATASTEPDPGEPRYESGPAGQAGYDDPDEGPDPDMNGHPRIV
jgi:hypothetical protein